MHRDEELLRKAMQMGILGYVLKENAVFDILSAIENVFKGNRFVSAQLTDFLLTPRLVSDQKTIEFTRESSQISDLLALLSGAELRVLQLVSKHGTNKSIAEELYISPKTVENHRSSICKKLGISGSFSLNRWVIAHYDEIAEFISLG
jgi:DNA-binding NarL/FixJ family response regulator